VERRASRTDRAEEKLGAPPICISRLTGKWVVCGRCEYPAPIAVLQRRSVDRNAEKQAGPFLHARPETSRVRHRSFRPGFLFAGRLFSAKSVTAFKNRCGKNGALEKIEQYEVGEGPNWLEIVRPFLGITKIGPSAGTRGSTECLKVKIDDTLTMHYEVSTASSNLGARPEAILLVHGVGWLYRGMVRGGVPPLVGQIRQWWPLSDLRGFGANQRWPSDDYSWSMDNFANDPEAVHGQSGSEEDPHCRHQTWRTDRAAFRPKGLSGQASQHDACLHTDDDQPSRE